MTADGTPIGAVTTVILEIGGIEVEGRIAPGESSDSYVVVKFDREEFRSLESGRYTATVTPTI